MQIQLPLLYFLDGCMYKWVSTAVLPRRVHVQVSIHMMQIQLPLLYFLDGCMYKWVSTAVLPWRVHVQVSIHDADSVTTAVLSWRMHVQVSIQIQLPLLYFLDGCMYKWVSRFSYRCCTSLTGACTSEYPHDADSVTAAVLSWRMHVQVSIQIQLPLLYFLDGCMYKWVSTWCRFSYRCCTSLTGACTSEYPWCRFSYRCCTSLTGACTSEYPWCRFSYHCCTSLTGACTSEYGGKTQFRIKTKGYSTKLKIVWLGFPLYSNIKEWNATSFGFHDEANICSFILGIKHESIEI